MIGTARTSIETTRRSCLPATMAITWASTLSWDKSNLHEEVTRVPLIICVPGFRPGRTASIAELVDIFPTLSELAGLDVPAELHGKSLVPILKDHAATVHAGALSFFKGHGWRTPDWAYLRYQDQTEELYDVQPDPGQFRNLAGNADNADRLNQMRKGLDARLKEAGLGGN